MSRHNRFGPALSLVAIASIMTGCAAPSSHVSSASGFGGKTNGEVGLATRALAELNANNIPAAIDFAERAVQKTPDDAGFRALLGSAYFAGGRFKSAEQAYKDSLSIYSNQPQVILKLALVDIALGKNSEALGFLEAGRDVLDPSDYGLAVALAGRPADAIPLLEAAARGPNSDARVRQNLALAYALNGDWTNARTVAAQDVPGDQLDARIHQWMQMAAPGHESIAVAALVGVTPAAVDPGQPTRLALRKTDTQMAQAPAPAPVAAPSPAFQSSPVQFAEASPAPVAAGPVTPAPAPVAPEKARATPVQVAEAAPTPAPNDVDFVSPRPRHAAPAAKREKSARLTAQAKPLPHAVAVARGSSRAVVQLGAYSNADRVLVAWNKKARQFRSLQEYTPVSARFSGPKGTFYRLSVKGFGSVNEAVALCSSLRQAGTSCFVRNVAGDVPMQIASR